MVACGRRSVRTGERVQLHKSGDVFHFYSRNLKPVTEHKVHHGRGWLNLSVRSSFSRPFFFSPVV
jgi:hypothetical protein